MALGRRRDQPAKFARPRLYQQLAEHITDFIEAQGLTPGDRLPPERELAAELGVSRATLAQALVALEMQGRVAVRHGDGAVVLDPTQRVAAVVAALGGYTAESLEAARIPVMAGILSTAAMADPSEKAAAPEAVRAGRPAAEIWSAIRAAAGVSPLVDLDIALEQAGAELPAQIVDALPVLVAAIETGDPAVFFRTAAGSAVGSTSDRP